MNVWPKPSTIISRRFALLLAGALTLFVALTTTLFFATVSLAAPGTNERMSFQGRLLNSSGGVVADGHYNMQFRIYQDGTGSTANNGGDTPEWTESYINNNAAQGVVVKNGYFSVDLGSKTPFDDTVDWNQDTLWLSINIAGSNAACTTFGTAPCAADGEMLPMKRLTSTPYSMNSKAVGGKTADQLTQLGQGTQTDTSSTASIAINKIGTGDIINLQSSSSDVFKVNSAGNIVLGSASNQSISVAQASSGAGKDLSIVAGDSSSGSGLGGGNLILQGGASDGSGSGSVVVKSNGSNSALAFDIQNTSGASVFSADTTNMGINVSGSITQTGTNLTLKSTLAPGAASNFPREMDIVGNYAYIANQGATGSFSIIDITNPGAPVSVGHVTNSILNGTRDVRVSGNYAYLTTFFDALVVIDIANASNPTIVGSIIDEHLNDAHGIDIQGSYAYIAADKQGDSTGYFSVYDISEPANPTYVTSLNHSNFGDAKQLDINGRYAYVTSGLSIGGVTIVDIKNPKAPVMLGNITSASLLSAARDIEVNGKYAYVVGDTSDTLVILDISNPNTPTIVGSVKDSVQLNEAFDVTLNGRYAYVASRGNDSIAVIDISNPTNPQIIGGGYSAEGLTPTATMMKGRYLYVVSNKYSITTPNFTILDTGGTSLTATSTNSLDTHTLQVHKNADIAGSLNVSNTMHVGQGGIATDGSLKVNGNTTLRSSTNSSDAFRVQNADGATILGANTADRQVRIGTVSGTDDVVLLTTDKSASAPSTLSHSAMLGSMYYDTTIGALQCYEAEGWGNCGASPDIFVTLSPEYTNAVMNGAGNGVITSDLCSDTLNINDVDNGTEICGENETYNFYNWTSTQGSAQTRSIYITHQLPENFKEFVADSASLQARTDSTNATVSYQIYRDSDDGLTSCGTEITASTGVKSSWQNTVASGTNDPSDCGFKAGDSVLFRINLTARSNANAYVSNLNFTFSTE